MKASVGGRNAKQANESLLLLFALFPVRFSPILVTVSVN